MDEKDEKALAREFNHITKQIQAEAGRYLAWLNGPKPLNDEFRMIKGRIVTLACQLRALGETDGNPATTEVSAAAMGAQRDQQTSTTSSPPVRETVEQAKDKLLEEIDIRFTPDRVAPPAIAEDWRYITALTDALITAALAHGAAPQRAQEP